MPAEHFELHVTYCRRLHPLTDPRKRQNREPPRDELSQQWPPVANSHETDVIVVALVNKKPHRKLTRHKFSQSPKQPHPGDIHNICLGAMRHSLYFNHVAFSERRSFQQSTFL
jgi:hypothetical protein